jgi:hypothetical protein
MAPAKQTDLKDQAATRRRLPQPQVLPVQTPTVDGSPGAVIQRASLGATALNPHDVLHLQRTVGNRAVGQLLSGTIQRLKQAPKVKRTNRDYPTEPSIAVNASRGSTWGVHAAVFIASGKPRAMNYEKVHLTYATHDDTKLNWRAKLNRSLFGRKKKESQRGVKIETVKATEWLDPRTSTTWRISNFRAKKAYDKARQIERIQEKLWYSHTGIGYRGWNCARFAEKVVQAAGVKATSGWAFKTPTELVSGTKLPMWSLSWKSKEGKAVRQEAMQQLLAEQAQAGEQEA